MPDINHDRRRFCRTAAMTIAAAQLGMIGAAKARSDETKPVRLPTMKPGTNMSLGHSLPPQAPHDFAEAVVEVAGY